MLQFNLLHPACNVILMPGNEEEEEEERRRRRRRKTYSELRFHLAASILQCVRDCAREEKREGGEEGGGGGGGGGSKWDTEFNSGVLGLPSEELFSSCKERLVGRMMV